MVCGVYPFLMLLVGLSAPIDVSAQSPDTSKRSEPTAISSLRIWTDSTGEHTIKARLIAFKMDGVYLKKIDGTSIVFPITKLSKADRLFVNNATDIETTTEPYVMFGQKIEGDAVGVILNVSGSESEYLPCVIREVDKNFKNVPIVYVRNMALSQRGGGAEVIIVIPEEVKPFNDDRSRTPFWFLWFDLARKAKQKDVARLIEILKARPNQFLAPSGGGSNEWASAIDFLVERKVDALYIFSEFEDLVDDDLAREISQNLGRRKIRVYVQSAEKNTENLTVMTKRIADRTLGCKIPALVSILRAEEGTRPTPQKP